MERSAFTNYTAGMLMKLSVVVPIHNEASNISELAGEIRTALEGRHEYELIFVDDGSDDNSPMVLEGLQRDVLRIRIVRHRNQCGQSTAIHSGVRHAENPVIVTLDGDGQNDPRDIGTLLDAYAKLQNKSDRIMVTGFRRRRQDSLIRRISSRVANGVRSRLLRDHTPDTGCGLKVFSRELFLSLPYFDHMHRFLPALVKRTGGTILSLEVNHRHRERGKSHYGTIDRLVAGIIDLLGVYWLLVRTRIPDIDPKGVVRTKR
jgi:dolichol-phosphate mannosyltransferase